MDTNKQTQFISNIYFDHLEEAMFLFEQRLCLLKKSPSELSWIDYKSIENRYEAHIDALCIGGDIALNICHQQSIEGDFTELHIATCVFIRQNRLDLINEILESLDPQDQERISAVTDALKHELPDSWQPEIIKMLSSNDKKLITIAAEVAGFRRINAENELLNLLHQNETSPIIIWAMGRMPNRHTFKSNIESVLLPYLNHKNENIRSESALTLLRTGVSDFLKTNTSNSKNLPFIPVGLSGNRSYVPYLIQTASEKDPHPDCLTALGLIGDISAINILIHHLDYEELAETAATALNLLTGAELYEDVFILEEIDEDLLFDDEIEKLNKGEPIYPPGEEPGTSITRISQNPKKWENWLAENISEFKTQIQYRNGKPHSPASLLETLKSKKAPRKIRQLAYEELVIRYNLDISFETDMFVEHQKNILLQIELK